MKKIIVLFLICVLFTGLADFTRAQSKPIIVHYFYGEGCPHCKKAKIFLDKLAEKYPTLEIKPYSVFDNKENAELLSQLFENCGKDNRLRVPAIFIGEDVIIGYLDQETSGTAIEKAINKCVVGEYIDPIKQLKNEQENKCSAGLERKDQIISLPIIGKINLSKLSLPVLTVIVGGLDGFNPCAMWVLIFLLALLVNMQSRKKMWLIGGTFILTSGIIYYVLLTAWLNLFLAISYVQLVRTIIGILAIVFGVLQLKKFTTLKPNVCPISESNSKIENHFKVRAEKIVATPALVISFFGVVFLAFGVNMMEFFCSAGLPAIYTQILALSDLSRMAHYLYLLLYTFIFMFDDLVVFFVAIITLDKLGFNKKYSRWSTLIGGLVILIIGLILILKPGLLVFG